jgi:hypothetical protein
VEEQNEIHRHGTQPVQLRPVRHTGRRQLSLVAHQATWIAIRAMQSVLGVHVASATTGDHSSRDGWHACGGA